MWFEAWKQECGVFKPDCNIGNSMYQGPGAYIADGVRKREKGPSTDVLQNLRERDPKDDKYECINALYKHQGAEGYVAEAIRT